MNVCVLGRIGYDLYAVEHNRPLAQVEHFSRHLGGSSANIAIGLARLGLHVGIIGRLGNDFLADYLLGVLSREGVDTQNVRLVEGYSTSLCLTEVSPPDRFPQVFYRAKPADSQVVLGEAEMAYIQQARMFVTNGTSLCASPSRESTLRALSTAHAAGLCTVFDVDYRASSWPSSATAGEVARGALPCVEVLLGNEDELLLLTGESDASRQAVAAMSYGVKIVVCKLGAKGVMAHTREGSWSADPIPVDVVSTIGAGDGFAAGFLYALNHGFPLAECLRYGNAAAAVVVSRVSCSDAMPRLDEVTSLLTASKATISAKPA